MTKNTPSQTGQAARWKRTPPQQQRGQRTLERIIEAAEALLENKPFETITLAEIVQQAGTTTGSFYARFASKEALLPHLYERYDARLQEGVGARLAGIDWARLDFPGAIRKIVDGVVAPYLERPWLLRAMAIFARTHPEALPEDVYERRREFHDQFVTVLRTYADAIDHRDTDQALRFGLFMIASTARDKLLFGKSPHAQLTDVSVPTLKHELARALHAYLT
jgi:AcrR family transcriptional regulator